MFVVMYPKVVCRVLVSSGGGRCLRYLLCRSISRYRCLALSLITSVPRLFMRLNGVGYDVPRPTNLLGIYLTRSTQLANVVARIAEMFGDIGSFYIGFSVQDEFLHKTTKSIAHGPKTLALGAGDNCVQICVYSIYAIVSFSIFSRVCGFAVPFEAFIP